MRTLELTEWDFTCDGCGAKQVELGYPHNPELPKGWVRVEHDDDYDKDTLCPTCAKKPRKSGWDR